MCEVCDQKFEFGDKVRFVYGTEMADKIGIVIHHGPGIVAVNVNGKIFHRGPDELIKV